MDSRSVNTPKSTNDIFPKIQQVIATSGYGLKSIVQNQSIQAEGSRDYGLGLLIVFIILIWPVAIIYYFTRKNNTVTVLLTSNNDGCRVDITSNGKSADRVLQLILNVL
jgi:hypothetical protein